MGKTSRDLEIGGVVTDFSSRMKYCDVQQLFDALMPVGQYRCYWKCHYLHLARSGDQAHLRPR
jgi:hypothetical protein